MLTSEKFVEMPVSFSDKKIIANDLAHLFVKIRFDKGNIAYLIAVSALFFLPTKNLYIIIPAITVFVLGFCLFLTKRELLSEFQSRHKLVGTFVIIGKKHFRKPVFKTKNVYIVVPKSAYEQVNLCDSIYIEKLPNGRILRWKKFIEKHNLKAVK